MFRRIDENDLIQRIQRRMQQEPRDFTPEQIEKMLRDMGIVSDDFSQRVTVLAEQLAAGRITLAQWKRAMQDEIRRYHLTSAIIGAGGLALAGASALLIARARLITQTRYFNQWAAEIESGTFPIDAAARLRQRARLYAGSGWATQAESFMNAMGLPTLPAFPRDGTTQCRNNCLCHWEVTKLEGRGNWDCRWVLGVAEHCDNCPRRAALWNPLQIRGGVIVPYNRAGLFR